MNIILVTGGAGFIGSALIRHILKNTNDTVINLDKLTYAGNLDSLQEIHKNRSYFFENTDICDKDSVSKILEKYKPNIIMNLAAESHVDKSIDSPFNFLHTNIFGTYNLLNCSLEYIKSNMIDMNSFLFHHISTDEVYGDLSIEDSSFKEDNAYNPSSPYSASKASSDHLVRAWNRTYGLRTVITNCSNNYGPYHFPEKLIPHIIVCALNKKEISIYGNGEQIRDWLYVDDHVDALYKVVTNSKGGETYNIGGNCEKQNIQVANMVCELLEELHPINSEKYSNYKELIVHVDDRPGHDERYSINASKIKEELGWEPKENFESGLRKTVKWYLKNQNWVKRVISGEYKLERQGSINNG